MLEVHRSYTANMIRQRFGDEKADEFLALFDGIVVHDRDARPAAREVRRRRHRRCPTSTQLARPFQGMSYESPARLPELPDRAPRARPDEAALGNRFGPLEGVARRAARPARRHPPGGRPRRPAARLAGVVRQVVHAAQLAAVRGPAGVPGRAVRRADARRDRRGGRAPSAASAARRRRASSTVESPHVVDSLHEATWLVEAHSPDPQLPRNVSPLYTQMREDGLVVGARQPGGRRRGPTGRRGGLNVSRRARTA